MPTALITGGTSGIGAAFARALAARGDDLVLVARDRERLARTAAALRTGSGVEVETIAADLADRAALSAVVDRLNDADRPIDTLVNNAGFAVPGRLATDDLAAQENALDVMCRAVLVLSGTAGARMRERGSGTIVNVSSVSTFMSMGLYSAVKAWVTTYTEALATELRPAGVTATALCPGFVRTEFHPRAGLDMSRLPGVGWIDADAVARTCLRDAQRGRVISIPTVRYRVAAGLARHAPRAAIRRISTGVMARRAPGPDDAQPSPSR